MIYDDKSKGFMILEQVGENYIMKIRAQEDTPLRIFTEEVYHITDTSYLRLIYGNSRYTIKIILLLLNKV